MTEFPTSTLTSGLGELIRCKRLEKQMTIQQLSDLSGTPKATLSTIETGETHSPDFRTLLVIASCLDIPIDELTELYTEAEHSPDALFTVFKEVTPNSLPVPLLMKIATKFLAINQRETSEESVERLYAFASELKEIPPKLALFKVISEFTDNHSIRPTLAKALLQSYLIERDDFTKLSKTYESGKLIQYHVRFLPPDDQIIYYYKIGSHAYFLGKYAEGIQFFKELISLDPNESIYKAYAITYSTECYYALGRYDVAEQHLNLLTTFDFPFVRSTIDFISAKLDGRRGDTDLAIIQLEHCLDSLHPKVPAMDALLELYSKNKDVSAAERLFLHENDFVDVCSKNNPLLVAGYADYYIKKSAYYTLINEHILAAEYRIKGIKLFMSVNRERDVHKHVASLLSSICSTTILQNPNIKGEVEQLAEYLNEYVTHIDE